MASRMTQCGVRRRAEASRRYVCHFSDRKTILQLVRKEVSLSARYGNGYYDCKDFTFQFVLGGDDSEHQLVDGPEFEQQHVEAGHLPAIFERLDKAGWKLVTSCSLPTLPNTVVFIFIK